MDEISKSRAVGGSVHSRPHSQVYVGEVLGGTCIVLRSYAEPSADLAASNDTLVFDLRTFPKRPVLVVSHLACS